MIPAPRSAGPRSDDRGMFRVQARVATSKISSMGLCGYSCSQRVSSCHTGLSQLRAYHGRSALSTYISEVVTPTRSHPFSLPIPGIGNTAAPLLAPNSPTTAAAVFLRTASQASLTRYGYRSNPVTRWKNSRYFSSALHPTDPLHSDTHTLALFYAPCPPFATLFLLFSRPITRQIALAPTEYKNMTKENTHHFPHPIPFPLFHAGRQSDGRHDPRPRKSNSQPR